MIFCILLFFFFLYSDSATLVSPLSHTLFFCFFFDSPSCLYYQLTHHPFPSSWKPLYLFSLSQTSVLFFFFYKISSALRFFSEIYLHRPFFSETIQFFFLNAKQRDKCSLSLHLKPTFSQEKKCL